MRDVTGRIAGSPQVSGYGPDAQSRGTSLAREWFINPLKEATWLSRNKAEVRAGRTRAENRARRTTNIKSRREASGLGIRITEALVRAAGSHRAARNKAVRAVRSTNSWDGT